MSDTGIQRIYRHESTEFTTVPNWVVRDPNYSPNTFRLLAYLLSHADGYELTYQQIERQTTLGRYAINQAAKFLIGAGWLEWEQKQGEGGRYLAKTWIIKNPQSTAPLPNGSGVESFHYGTINGHKEEQSLKKNTIREEHSQSDNLFNEFWNLYPKKIDKAQAKRQFKRALNRVAFEDILAGVIKFSNDQNLPDEKRFIKNPATWLNADGWEEGPLPERKKAKTQQTDWDALERYAKEQDAKDENK